MRRYPVASGRPTWDTLGNAEGLMTEPRPPDPDATAAYAPPAPPGPRFALAAALAAGETPSPQLVADAGEEGSLRPLVAVTLLAGVLAGLAAFALLADRTKMFRQVPLHTPPEALVIKARELLARLGHTDPPADSAWMFARDVEYVEHQRRQPPSPERWQSLATGRPAAMYFWYRQSPRLLVVNSRLNFRWPFGAVTPDDPPPTVSGMATVWLDPVGRLLEFRAVPPRAGAPPGPEDRPDWDTLFAAAELEPRQFQAVTPKWRPSVFADQRSAWAGAWPDRPGSEVRIEAAACGGAPVYFRVVDGPWAESERGSVFFSPPRSEPAGEYAGLAWFGLALAGGAALAWRNWRLGRGDRRGAFRLAAALVTVELLTWATFAHHVPSLDPELTSFTMALGGAVFLGGLLWLAYLALEPAVRRRWPWRITAWNRLLAGRFRDPLVGRDVLVGALAGVAMLLCFHLPLLGPVALGLPPATPMGIIEPSLTQWAVVVFSALTAAIGNALLQLLLLSVLLLVLRREWLAGGVWLTLLTLNWYAPGDYPLATVLRHGGTVAVMLAVLLRLGLLSAVVGFYSFFLLNAVPVTADVSAWYFRSGAIALAVVLGLALCGFVVSLGGRPLVGKGFFGDE
jgi:serine/threonine-protein kinase